MVNNNLLEQCATIYLSICKNGTFVPLSTLIDSIETGSRPKGGALTEGIPSVGAEKIESFGCYDYSTEKYIGEEYFSKLKRGIVASGDVLLYKDGAYTGKSSMALDGFPHARCAVNEHVFILRSADKYAQAFLYFTVHSEEVRQKIHSLACGKAAQPGLNQQELLSVEVKIPSVEEIIRFESLVEPIMHQVALNALENKKLCNLRDISLPKLISGEIDVSKVDV